MSDGSSSTTNTIDQLWNDKLQQYSRLLNTDPNFTEHKDTREDKSRNIKRNGLHFAPNEIQLKENQKLTKHVLPEAPLNLLQFRAERQSRCFLAFGVPMSHLNDQKKHTSKLSNVGGSAQGSGSDTIFIHAQRELKQHVLGFIRLMYAEIHYNRILLTKLSKSKKIDNKLIQNIMPDVSISSLPDDAIIDKLYNNGFLKYQAITDIYAAKYGLNKKMFNLFPTISIKELNKVKDETKPKKAKTSK